MAALSAAWHWNLGRTSKILMVEKGAAALELANRAPFLHTFCFFS
jgi:hypothetical protein